MQAVPAGSASMHTGDYVYRMQATTRRPRAPRAIAYRFGVVPLLTMCLVLLVGTPHPARAQDEHFTESVVVFNTVCARCHEAQCSGRLSFDSRYEAAVRHIVRHYSGAEDKVWLQKELFAILDYMKRHCAYYPMDVPIPPQRVWGAEVLGKFGNLLEHDYFVPLGPFEPGEYRLRLELAGPVRVNVHLVDESFEMVIDECMTPDGNGLSLPFTVERPVQLYFRLYTQEPTPLRHLAVEDAS